MKQTLPAACCMPRVAASLFVLPRPAATICSINQSPGASGASTHTHIHRHTYFNNCLHSSCHTWPCTSPPSFALFPPSPLSRRTHHFSLWRPYGPVKPVDLQAHLRICCCSLKGFHSELCAHINTHTAVQHTRTHTTLTNTLLSPCVLKQMLVCVCVSDHGVYMHSDNW